MAKKDLSGYATAAIGNLCHRVEETTGIVPATPKMFEKLAEAVRLRTGVLLSPTTLKRIWGYLNEDTTPRSSTLDVLAQCCGWHDYKDFFLGNVPEVESGPVGGDRICVDEDIKRGDRISLTWPPARVCIIKYLGHSEWRVEKSEGTRLQPGDTFRCQQIVGGEPLYLDNLVQQGRPATVYVCGRRSGVRFERCENDTEQHGAL